MDVLLYKGNEKNNRTKRRKITKMKRSINQVPTVFDQVYIFPNLCINVSFVVYLPPAIFSETAQET